MNKILKFFIADPLFKQSGMIFTSSVIVNIFNLIFWLFMVRQLTAEDYGVLNSLVSILMFFSMPVSILQTVITRYTSKFMAHQQQAKVQSLVFYFVKLVGIFVGVVLLILILGGRAVSGFLQINEQSLIYMVAAGIALSSLAIIPMGALSGLQKFNDVAVNNVATGVSKLLTGFILVIAGLGVLGALSGFVISFAVMLSLSIFQLPKWLRGFSGRTEEAVLNIKEIYSYFLPAGLGILSFFALTNMDIILVKHFFPPPEAGYYSVAQIVGKIVLFVPGAIGIVMFPKIVDAHAKGRDPLLILKKCLMAVSILCGSATFCAFLIPGLILKILTGHSQPLAISLVKFFSLAMGFFALVQILMLYHLSLRQLRYIYTLAVIALFQFLALWFFHSSLGQVLWILLSFSVVLFYLGTTYAQVRRRESI